jgi:signal transduction histidine kinase
VPERARSAELAALTSIAAQVNCTQELEEILAGALQTTLEVVGADAGEVYLLDEDSGALVLYAQKGLSPLFVEDEAVLGRDECLCGLSFESRELVQALDLASHPARTRPACLREGFSSLLCLPLRARGVVLGLLNLQSRAPRRFSAADEEFLTAIGNQIGIAVANAQLIDDAEQRRATLDSVMTSLIDGLILLDRRGRIAYVNPCAAEMLGLVPGALLGQPAEAVERQVAARAVDPGPEPGWLQGTLSRLDAEPAAELDPAALPAVALDLAAPLPRSLQARFFPIHEAGGGRLGLGLLLHDVTRDKELDRMKSQLLATVSHELRTPLASIKGFATTLLRRDVQWDEEERREFLAIIDEESDRLSELIGNLLDMSRIEAGELRVEPERIDLRPLVDETVAEFQVLTRAHRFAAHLPADLPPVWADPRRTRQVLRNLVENAVKYSPGGGPVAVAAELRRGWVQVRVSDRGLGIEPPDLPRIFERFYQVDSASTRQVGGSGLGLAISRAIVEAQGGQIWAESQPGVGSTFFFTLPLEGETNVQESEHPRRR